MAGEQGTTTAPRLVRDLADGGDRPALVEGDTVLTHRELAGRVERLAAALDDGTRRLALVRLDRRIDDVVAYLAALAAGHAVLVAPPGPGPADELAGAWRPAIDLGDGEIRRHADAPHHQLHPELTLLLSTSGTTGSPRLVRLGREGIDANASAIAESLRLTAADRALTTLPLHYCYGLSVLHSHLLVHGCVVLASTSVVDPCTWAAVERRGVTNFAAVPHTFELLDRIGFADRSVPGLRLVTQAGGRLAPDQVRRWAAIGRGHGWELAVMYGQTEATARMAVLPPGLAETHPDAAGRALPGTRFEIDRTAAPDGADPDVGEVVFVGPNVMLGYAETPADLARGRDVTELRTGDLGRLDDAGLLHLVGRAARFAKPFGLRIDLDAVEADLAAAGWPSQCVGDDHVLAVVAVAPDAAAVHDRVLARTGLPRGAVCVRLADELARTDRGKPDYAAARHLLELDEDEPSATPSATTPSTATPVAELLAAVLGVAAVDPSDTFVSAGGDSLSYVEASIRLEAALGHLPGDWHLRTVGELEAMADPELVATRRRWVRVETGVLVRAAAIVLIVARHLDLSQLAGGAHALLGLAGYNLARFQLDGVGAEGTRRRLRSAARVAVPTMAWLGLLAATGQPYGPASLTLTNSLLAEPRWSLGWRYWFVEVLVQLLVVVTAVLAVPGVARAERRWPYPFALGALALALVGRPDGVVFGDPYRHLNTVTSIAWLFALGWVVARSTTIRRRLVATALVVVLVPGFFGDGRRDAIVVVGFLALTWLPQVVLPAVAARLVATLAGASLAVYLTHWELYPRLLPHAAPSVVLAVCLVVGVVVWRAGGALTTRARLVWRRRTRRRTGAVPGAADDRVRERTPLAA